MARTRKPSALAFAAASKALRRSPVDAFLAENAAPLFRQEGPQLYGAAYRHNAQFAAPSMTGWQTPLDQGQERQFESWVSHNRIPFDPHAAKVDYDMRGYWQSLGQGGQHRAANGHFPDTYKTPYDTTFSAESKYAKHGTPFVWRGNKLVDTRTGRTVFA